MTEQLPQGRPISAKAAGYQALGRKWKAENPNAAEEQQQRHAEAESAQQDLVNALRAAGFEVYPTDISRARQSVGIGCGRETALALAEWLRAQPPAKK